MWFVFRPSRLTVSRWACKGSAVSLLLVAPLLLNGCLGASGNPAPAPVTPSPAVARSHFIKTVFLIVMENHNWSSIKGNAAAPYINHDLLPKAAYARRYYNPRGIHPSLPNYLWLEAGSNLSVTSDCGPGSCGNLRATHFVDLLNRADISWKAYEESAPQPCPTSDLYPYAAKHDPFVYFHDVTAHAAYCRRHIVPFTHFFADLRRGAVARYNFITPNLCHDMHDDCSPTFNAVAQGDSWLSRTIPSIMRSRAYSQGGLILITWDEGEGGDGPIGMIAVSQSGKGRGYSNGIVYSASSTLRSLEEIFHVRPFLRGAARVADLRDLFARFP